MSVFLDTGVLFAFLNVDDARHAEARELVRKAALGAWGAPATSDFVADELLTLVRARTRSAELERRAAALLPLPTPALPGLRLLPVAPHHLGTSLRLFEQHRGRGLSFTDASHLALMAAYGIERLATFGKGFDGLAEVVP